MIKNMQKNIDEGKEILSKYPQMSITTNQVQELIKKHGVVPNPGLFGFITDLFYLGVAVGVRKGKKLAKGDK